MQKLNRLHKIFDMNIKRAKESYKPKPDKKGDGRTARSSSLNNALKNIQNNLRGIQ